jgi:CheY-like chemotaxis protein/HPt (histidine-containing phosphotransfer) domain-containing protein
LRILIAEDNAVNQKLARSLLEKQGHAVTVANNGQEAVAAFVSHEDGFDVILMDVQMPGMNGLEATEAIRRLEGESSHVPIIAMTARAMTGDRETCLRSGMDAYLSKPVRRHELLQALSTVSPRLNAVPVPAESAGKAECREVTAEAWNLNAALERAEGDRDLLRDLCELFVRESQVTLAAIGSAIATGDWKALERAAHTLKGSVAVFGADSAASAAKHLETIAHSAGEPDLQRVDAAFTRLQDEIERLRTALDGWLLAGATPSREPDTESCRELQDDCREVSL